MVLLPAGLAAQEPVRPDSVASADSVRPAPPALFGADPAIRLGLKPVAPPFAVRFRDPPGLDRPDLWPRFDEWALDWRVATRERLDARVPELWAAAAVRVESAGSDTVSYLPPPPRRDTSTASVLPGELGQYADLGMRISGRGEMGGSWNRYEPCDATSAITCNPSLFPQIRPDIQFGVQVGGTVSDRIHINVDYDQRREFDAANNIHVYYQGFEDEILQRLEVGDVSLNLPASRFLTQGIPAGNFGFKATGQVGPLDFQTVWAQQKGDVNRQEFRLGGSGGQQGLVQDLTVVRDDADYVQGQFFYVVHPDSLPGAPHIDPLSLQTGDAPASLAPRTTVAVFRYEGNTVMNPQQQGNLGYFRADGVSPTGETTHSGLWRRLNTNEDYQVHQSGLWLVLRSPLGRDEALAIAYETRAGTVIGTLNPEAAPEGSRPELRLLRGPAAVHQPDHVSGTWKHEMHQVYRVDSSDGVEDRSVELEISLGESSAGATYVLSPTTGDQVEYLRLFGLDEDSPSEKLDEAALFMPRKVWTDPNSKLGGVYVVFPTLEPFRAPPPVPSAGLSDEEAALALGNAANVTIYDNPDPVTRGGAARFRLNFAYRVKSDGQISSFSLGALGIREGSEKIYLNDQLLRPGEDYTVDYDIGEVILNNPDRLLGANAEPEIRASWEQKALFELAPTSVFGLNGRYLLGERGEINFISLYQSEKSLMSRPQLGTEPGAIFLNGVSGRFDLGGALLDRAVAAIPGLKASGLSGADLQGEIALSSPNPNTRGETYLDDFEATDEVRLGVGDRDWRLGSAPGSHMGDEGVLPGILDANTAGGLVWQNLFAAEEGRYGGQLYTSQIDGQIRVVGNEVPEAVMYLTFGDTLGGSGRLWRSLTTVLSTTGRDMSQSEYLELYVNHEPGQELALIFDIGTVSEDAFYVSPDGLTSGIYEDGEPWGLGRLDQEGAIGFDVWGDALDQRGLWDQPCQAERGAVYGFADPAVNCTRGNGVRDTEDLDGNGEVALDDGQYFRYVLELDGSEYLVRDTAGTGTSFALYRIPLRGSGSPVNGADESTWRFIKHLRMTVVGAPGADGPPLTAMVVARPRITGSRWPKRDVHGIRAGLTQDSAGIGALSTRLRVGPVSRLTDSDYVSPPGVVEQLQDPSSSFGIGGQDITEKGIKLSYQDLIGDERAEIYYRYSQQPRNFLDYRSLSVWALPRAGTWGESGAQWLLVKVGTDASNYYIYRTRLHEAPTGNASGADWQELVIDFEEWFELKAQAERSLIQRAAEGAAETRIEPLWSEDGRYGIVLQDRFQAPNLAAVREISFAVYNEAGIPVTGEVWINELRSGAPLRQSGMAGHLDLNVRAADFLRMNVSYSNEGAVFRRGLDASARYQQMGAFNFSADADMARFAPAGWGIAMPVSVSHSRTGQDPLFLERSDVRADRLEGLRTTGSDQTRVGVSLRKRTPTSNPWLSLLVDGVALQAAWRSASTGAITSRNEAAGFNAGLTYSRQPALRDFDITPGFIEAALRALLPAPLESSGLYTRLAGARLRWTPQLISFGHQYNRQQSRSWRYEQILELPGDSLVTPLESPRRGLDSNMRLGFRFFESLNADVTLTSTRDLLAPELASKKEGEREALANARSELGGVDVGWERSRALSTSLQWRPQVTPWLTPQLGFSSRYSTDRTPSYLEVIELEGDSVTVMQRQFRGQRQVNQGLQLEPIGLVAAVFGADAGKGLVDRVLYGVARSLQPVSMTWNSSLNSSFDRETGSPDLGYQFGLGGMESWRYLGEGDTAKTATEQSSFQASSGVRLPGGIGLSGGYSNSQGEVFDLRGGENLVTQRSWPDLSLSWSSVPLPARLKPYITNISVSTGYQRQLREETLQDRLRRDHAIPLQLSLTFPGGMSASYTGSISGGTGQDNTGETEQTSRRHAFTMRSSFNAPGTLTETFQKPIQASLRFSLDGQRNCRARMGGDEPAPCTPFQDQLNRSLDLTLDTMIQDVSLGLQGSYVTRQSFVGQRNGNSQFQFSLFGQFNFAAGNFGGPTGMPGGVR